jgi:DNA-binding response OmpR family regulator
LTEDPLTNIVDVYIGRLRKLLRAGSGAVTIETLRGIGYRIVQVAGTSQSGEAE